MAGRRWCALPLPILFPDPKTFGKLPLGQLSWTPGDPLSSQQHWELRDVRSGKECWGKGAGVLPSLCIPLHAHLPNPCCSAAGKQLSTAFA